MAYCVLDDLKKQVPETVLIQLTDDADTGSIDTDHTDQAIADADAKIDSYCGKRYSVPFSPVPDILKKTSVDIAIYNLYSRRKGAPDHIEKRFNAAIQFLRDVSKGQATLGEDDPDGNPPDSEAPEMSSSNPDRVFTRDTLTGF